MQNESDQIFSNAYTKIINLSLLVTLVVSIIILIVGWIIDRNYYYAVSYFLGAMTNIFGLTLIKSEINKNFDNSNNIKGFFIGGNVFRFAFYGLIVYISTLKETLNPFIVISGLFTVRIAIYIYAYLHRNS